MSDKSSIVLNVHVSFVCDVISAFFHLKNVIEKVWAKKEWDKKTSRKLNKKA